MFHTDFLNERNPEDELNKFASIYTPAMKAVCGELLIFDTNQQFATHSLGALAKY